MNIDKEDIEDKLVGFIKDNLLAPDVALAVDDSLTALGLDSFSLIEILLFVERQFNTVVPIEELNREKTETVRAISAEVQYFMNK